MGKYAMYRRRGATRPAQVSGFIYGPLFLAAHFDSGNTNLTMTATDPMPGLVGAAGYVVEVASDPGGPWTSTAEDDWAANPTMVTVEGSGLFWRAYLTEILDHSVRLSEYSNTVSD